MRVSRRLLAAQVQELLYRFHFRRYAADAAYQCAEQAACQKSFSLGLHARRISQTYKTAAAGRGRNGPEPAGRISLRRPYFFISGCTGGRSRFTKQMNDKIVYDLETDPMRTSVNVFSC